MKASVLIQRLTELIVEYGDLEVGLRDAEFYDFLAVHQANAVTARTDDHLDDDAELGFVFIGIDFNGARL